MVGKIFLSLFALLCSPILADSYLRGDSGITGPKYSEILNRLSGLQSQYSDRATLIEYGKSVQGRPLKMLLVTQKDPSDTEKPAMLMTGSTHGNEYLNIEDRLPAELLKKSLSTGPVLEYLERGGSFIFVPIINPDGYEARRRENANGVDLNRDFDVAPAGYKAFKEEETRLLSTALETLRKQLALRYVATIDYHCCVGAVLHPWGYKKGAIPAPDLEAHLAYGEIAKRHLNIEVGTTGDILGYYPLGTSRDYYYDRYHALAFTYEGRYGVENTYLKRHVAWWEEMTGLFLQHSTSLINSVSHWSYLRFPPFPS